MASTSRRIGFRITAILLGLLPLLTLELMLRVMDQPRGGNTIDAISEANGSRRLFVLNDETDRYTIAEDRLNFFCQQSFPRDKGPATKRIFVLGGSTVQGRPYATETAFSKWLQLSLSAALPDTKWQVINCGGVSYASYRVAAIMDEVVEYQPDLIILYTGHNEFLEAQSFGDLQKTPDWLVSLTSAANSLRTVSFAKSLLNDAAHQKHAGSDLLEHEVDTLLDHRGGLEKYRRNDPPRRAVVCAFEQNLLAMIDRSKAAHVPILLCVPSCNLLDCPPFKSELPHDLSEDLREEFSRKLALARAETDLDKQLQLLQQCNEIDPKAPYVSYQLGRIQYENGQFAKAKSHLLRAKDNDVCPLRILTTMEDTIRRIAAGEQLPIADIDRLLSEASPHGIVSRGLMVDHVHPSVRGHQLIAKQLIRILVEEELIDQPASDWDSRRAAMYDEHLNSLGEEYYARGKQRLEGLRLWAAGRANQAADNH